jgi:UPF0176 protein
MLRIKASGKNSVGRAMCRNMNPAPKAYVNLSGYRFMAIEEPESKRENLLALCQKHAVMGTLLLTPEGLNVAIAGLEKNVRQWVRDFEALGFTGFWLKESFSDHLPFDKIQVKLKREIISVRNPALDPLKRTAQNIRPEDLKSWLDEGRDFTLLDTRNNYEIRMGAFRKAVGLGIEEFQNFETSLRSQTEKLDPAKPLVMYCTGGVRCEKAAFAAADAGFQEVYQLEGGILNYFEKCGGDHWAGECFVFDKRVGVLPNLEESQSLLCWACGEPLSVEDQKSPDYVYRKSCPYCVGNSKKNA